MYDVGYIAGVDSAVRALVGTLEVFIPLSVARETLLRSPDTESEDTVSWGNVSLAELQRLFGGEPHPNLRDDYLEHARKLIQTGDRRNVYWCIYYPRNPIV